MSGKAEVDRLKKRLDATFDRCRKVGASGDLETQADFAKYLCVLVSGYLEKAVAELLLEHARRCGGPTLQKYVEATTKKFTNANAEKLKSLLGSFDSDWRLALDVILIDELKDAVDSVVSLRHAIAHGNTATVTYHRINDYYERVQKVVDHIAQLCVP
jgi:hypothetical protein